MRLTLIFALIVGSLFTLAELRAQERPLTVTGTFVSGYYTSTSRGQENQSINFAPVGAKFDISTYILSPDFIDISAEPELNYGAQASDAGFQGGNGFKFRSTLLRKGKSPITFHYSNVQLEDVVFGSLTQLSGYSLKNRNKDLGVTWELKLPRAPSLIVDWGTASVDSKPGIPNLSDYLSSGSHLNMDLDYERWGWSFDGFMHRQQQTSNLLAQDNGSAVNGSLVQTVLQYQASARRTFWRDSEVYVDGGSQSTASLLIALPVDLTTRYTNANLRLFQKRRWKASFRAGYSSNLASQLLAQAAGALAAPGSAASDVITLLPFSRGLASLNLNGLTNLSLGYGFGAYAGIERNSILSSSDSGAMGTSYFTTSTGVTYAHPWKWGNLSGDYGREFGVGSITGQSGTIQGQTWRVAAEKGRSGGFIVDVTFHGSDQYVQNVQPLSNRSEAVEGSISGRIAGSFGAHVGGGWQWGDVVNMANDFRTSGYTARAGIDHPRFQIGASLNNSVSDSLPFYSQFLNGNPLDATLIAPLRIVPSDYKSLSLNFHANPMRKLEVSALWTHSLQHLDGFLNNDFELMNFYVTYHFRRIQIETGFIRSNQVFLAYPDTMRQRFYIRFQRTARLL